MQKEKLVFHNGVHLCELLSWWLLTEFPQGEEVYPGIKTASVEFMSTTLLPTGKTSRDYPKTLFVGCALSELDEHTLGEELGDLECSATLVAKKLNLIGDRALQKMLADTLYEDRHASRVPLEIAFMIKLLNRIKTVEEVRDWAFTFFRALYTREKMVFDQIRTRAEMIGGNNPDKIGDEEKKICDEVISSPEWQAPITFDTGFELVSLYFPQDAQKWRQVGNEALNARKASRVEAKKILKKDVRTHYARTETGRRICIGFVETDNDQMNDVCRNTGIKVLIQKNSQGNIQIFADVKHVNLRNMAALWRRREQGIRGSLIVKNWNTLRSVGTLSAVPQIHLMDRYGENKGPILNGSLGRNSVEPTAVPWEELWQLVQISLIDDMCQWFFELLNERCGFHVAVRKVLSEIPHWEPGQVTQVEETSQPVKPKPMVKVQDDPALRALFDAFDAGVNAPVGA